MYTAHQPYTFFLFFRIISNFITVKCSLYKKSKISVYTKVFNDKS